MIYRELVPVKGFVDYYVDRDGKVVSTKYKMPRTLKPQTGRKGYKHVTLWKGDKAHTETIHRLVALSFIPNLYSRPQVNHKNGNKEDNRVENLEWATNSENQLHARATGLNKGAFGESSGNAKLTEVEVLEIRAKLNKGAVSIKLCAEYGITSGTMSSIKTRRTWKHI